MASRLLDPVKDSVKRKGPNRRWHFNPITDVGKRHGVHVHIWFMDEPEARKVIRKWSG